MPRALLSAASKMEIEAKFTIPDANVARRLRSLTRCGAFTLTAPQTLRVRDTFFDSSTRALRATRHVLRVRFRSDGKTFITLKAPTQKNGALHRRPEIEVPVVLTRAPKILTRASLPARIYKLIAQKINDAPLRPLFSISQTRHVRVLKNGRRIIGEWSVDRVEFRAGARRHAFYELEVELKKSGTEQELAEFIATLQKQIHLEPQRAGKFERALTFYQAT